ncbi:hypothetical protein N185_15625 [Sinorhizobium sp. GW3]|nr:hypothetical protein N185_15625 [Sinorhizobium sp. GW3]
MAKPRKVSSFFVVVVDRDKKQFSVEGPTSDEAKWHEARERAEAAGCDIDVHVYQDEDSLIRGILPNRDDIIERYRETYLGLFENVRPGTILGKHMFR